MFPFIFPDRSSEASTESMLFEGCGAQRTSGVMEGFGVGPADQGRGGFLQQYERDCRVLQPVRTGYLRGSSGELVY